MGTLSSLVGVVKSVQRGLTLTTSTTGTITISSVNTAKSILVCDVKFASTSTADYMPVTLVLTNATTLTWTSASSLFANSNYNRIMWQVIEFY